MFRKDRDRFGAGLMFWINEQIPNKVPLILLEFTVKHRRCLCLGIYRPPSQNETYFIDHLSKSLDQLTCQYGKTMLLGNFNLTIDNKSRN